MKRNPKWKIPHTALERQTLCFSSYKNSKLKVKLWWVGSRDRRKRSFFVLFILSKGNFFNICFISMYSVLNRLQNRYVFRYKRNYFICFLLVLKSKNIWSNFVESLNKQILSGVLKNKCYCDNKTHKHNFRSGWGFWRIHEEEFVFSKVAGL